MSTIISFWLQENPSAYIHVLNYFTNHSHTYSSCNDDSQQVLIRTRLHLATSINVAVHNKGYIYIVISMSTHVVMSYNSLSCNIRPSSLLLSVFVLQCSIKWCAVCMPVSWFGMSVFFGSTQSEEALEPFQVCVFPHVHIHTRALVHTHTPGVWSMCMQINVHVHVYTFFCLCVCVCMRAEKRSAFIPPNQTRKCRKNS